MKKRSALLAFGLCLQFLVFSVSNVLADEFCVAGAVLYKLQTGVAGDAGVVNGIRLGAGQTTIAGTFFTADDGTLNIGFTEHFNWGSGAWIDPAGVTVLKFPLAGDATYDTTYYGASNPPRTFAGTATVVACPSQPRAPVGDPNWIPSIDRQIPSAQHNASGDHGANAQLTSSGLVSVSTVFDGINGFDRGAPALRTKRFSDWRGGVLIA